ncbi:MAG: twin-arginine translocase TatA/TatE family subunit [Proteobacteria bacterium]|nr:twin-arginine translocase TatA/TatE family subunit [Pseudomonadota bacterium]
MPSAWELGVVLVIVLVIFGPGKLPQVFRSLGQGLKSFRDAQKDEGAGAPKDVTRAELPPVVGEEAHEVKTKEMA